MKKDEPTIQMPVLMKDVKSRVGIFAIEIFDRKRIFQKSRFLR